MINQKTQATTKEMCALAAITPQRLSQLEKEGVVQRAGRNRWPLVVTMNKILADARSRNRASEGRQRFETARAANEELKLARRRGELVNFQDMLVRHTEDMAFVWGVIAGIPAAHTRDLKERKRLAELVSAARERCHEHWQSMLKKVNSGE